MYVEGGENDIMPFSKPGEQSKAPNRVTYILNAGRGNVYLSQVFGNVLLRSVETDVGNPNGAPG